VSHEGRRRQALCSIEALKQIIPTVQRIMLFDFDDADQAFHPQATNPSLYEWRRKNIENYLLIAPAWRRAAAEVLQCAEGDLSYFPQLPRAKSRKCMFHKAFRIV